MAGAGELPHTPYYGSVDSTPLWLILLGETFDWTGDRGPARPAVAQRARRPRLDRHVRRPRRRRVRRVRAPVRARPAQPGLEGLQRRDPRPRRARGRVPPIALAEVQGYVFDAKRRMAGLARVRGDDELADAARADAETLRERFEAAFWVEDQRYYAMALDRDKRQADAIGSNAGQCLWTGIVSPERAATSSSGCSTRRCSRAGASGPTRADQPGYNPIGYHTGHGLAARHVADRGRPEALRVRRRGQPRGQPGPRGRPAVRRVPAARAVLRLRPRATRTSRSRTRSPARRRRGPPASSFLFLTTMLGLAAARGPRRARAAAPAPARRGSAGSRSRTCASARRPWTCCSTAGAGRRAPRCCARSATSTSPSGSEPDPPVTTIAPLLSEAIERLRAAGVETPRLDAELLLGHAVGVERTTIIAHPDAPVGPGAEGTFRARSGPAAGRRAGRLHPRASRSSTGSPSPSTPGRSSRDPRPSGSSTSRSSEVMRRLAIGVAAAGRRAARARRRDGERRDRDLDRRRTCAGAACSPTRSCCWPSTSRRTRSTSRARTPSGTASGTGSGSRPRTSSRRPRTRACDIVARQPAVRPRRRDGRRCRSPTTFEPALALDGGAGRARGDRPAARPAAAASLADGGDRAPRDRRRPGRGDRRRSWRRGSPGWTCRVEPDLAGLPRVAVSTGVPGEPPGRDADGRHPRDRAGVPDPPDRPRHRRDAGRRRPRRRAADDRRGPRGEGARASRSRS